MDPTILTAAVIAALTPYAKKAAEEFAGEVGKTVFEKTESLMGWIKQRFTSNPMAFDVIRRFEAEPDKYSPYVEDVLLERLKAEPAMAAELSQLVEDIKKTGPTVNVVLKMKEAEEVVGLRIKEANRGTANVNMDIEKGKKIVGADVEKLG